MTDAIFFVSAGASFGRLVGHILHGLDNRSVSVTPPPSFLPHSCIFTLPS